MNVLILGHTGFVGKNMVKYLSGDDSLAISGASRSTGVDLRDEENVLNVINQFKPDFIVNCAAHVGSLNYVTEKAAEVISDNTKMSMSLYQAIAKCSQPIVVINPIANCAFPGEANIYKESEWLNGPIHRSVLSYGNSRRLLWAFSECYRMQFAIKSINLFVPNMYGPHDSTDPNKAHALNALIAKFTKAYSLKQNEIPVWGSGKVIREWLYAEDFAKIVGQVIKSPMLQEKLSNPVNIGQNFGLTITELVNIINHGFGEAFHIVYDTSKPDGAQKKVMSDEVFRSIFPNFKFTDFNSGIPETIAYYKTQLPY